MTSQQVSINLKQSVKDYVEFLLHKYNSDSLMTVSKFNMFSDSVFDDVESTIKSYVADWIYMNGYQDSDNYEM